MAPFMAAQVREAQLEDTPAVCRMLLELGHDAEEPLVRRRLERVLGTTDHVVFLAFDRPHGIIGMLHASVEIGLIHRPLVEIEAIVVANAHRCTGIGRLLLERVHNWALRRGIDDVAAQFQRHRKAAHLFYGKLGYSVASELRSYQRDLASPLRERERDPTAMD